MGLPPEISKLVQFMQANFGSEGKAKLGAELTRSGVTKEELTSGVRLPEEKRERLADNIFQNCFQYNVKATMKLRMIQAKLYSTLQVKGYTDVGV